MPRKTPNLTYRICAPDDASMRPRPDAAENPSSLRRSPVPGPRFNEAAARCRGKPDLTRQHAGEQAASMRPRPDAAENAMRRRPTPRGKQRLQ